MAIAQHADDIERWHSETARNRHQRGGGSPDDSDSRPANSVISGWNSSLSAHSLTPGGPRSTPGDGDGGGEGMATVREGADRSNRSERSGPLASSRLTQDTDGSADTERMDNSERSRERQREGGGGGGGGYFNLSRAGERERFMEVMSGSGAKGDGVPAASQSRQQQQREDGDLEPASMPFELPDMRSSLRSSAASGRHDAFGSDRSPEIRTFRMGHGAGNPNNDADARSYQRDVHFPPDGSRHHQLGQSGTTGDRTEGVISMADLLDEERSRTSGLRLGGRGGRRQGRLNRAMGGMCGLAPSCGVRAPSCFDRCLGRRGTKRRRWTLILAMVLVAGGVAAAVSVLVGTGEDESVKKSSKSEDVAVLDKGNETLGDFGNGTSGGNETSGEDKGGSGVTDGPFDLNLTGLLDLDGMPSRRPTAASDAPPSSGNGTAPVAAPAAVPSLEDGAGDKPGEGGPAPGPAPGEADGGDGGKVPTLDAVAMGVSASPESEQVEEPAAVAASTSSTSSTAASAPAPTPLASDLGAGDGGPSDEDDDELALTSSSALPFDFAAAGGAEFTSTAATMTTTENPFEDVVWDAGELGEVVSDGIVSPGNGTDGTNGTAAPGEADGGGGEEEEEEASLYGYLASTDGFGSFGES